jgi:thiamine biosynthesis lipoprotein
MQRISRRRFAWSLTVGAGSAVGVGWLGSLARQKGGAASASSRSPTTPAFESVHEESLALGTKVAITVVHPDREAARSAVRAAWAELALVDRLMSLYRPDSPLCRLNHRGVLDDPHPYLVSVLGQAQALSAATDGAFDVTVQPLWTLYSAAAKTGGLPNVRTIEVALGRVDWRRVEISPQQIRLRDPGTAVTLNGIAQGFAADRAMAALRRHGIGRALVDAGEIGTLGGKGASEPWKIGIQHPRRKDAYVGIAELEGRCLATSGDYATSFGEDCRAHHILDPHTGRSPTVLASVTIAAPTATQADALATAVFVLGPERGLQLMRSTPSVDGLLVLKDGRTLATQGFPSA